MRVQGSRVDCCSDVGECRPRPHCHTPPSAPTSLKRSVIFCQMLNFVISGVVFFCQNPWRDLSRKFPSFFPQWTTLVSRTFSWFPGRFSYFLTFFREIFLFSHLFSKGDFLIFLPFLREMSPLFISPSLAVWMKLVLFSPPAVFSCRRFLSLSIS